MTTKTKFPIEPLFNKVIVKRADKDTQKVSAGGIILVDNPATPPPLRGEIIAIGPGRMLPDGAMVALDLKIGDTVFFSQMGQGEIEWENETYCVITDNEIFGKITNY
jgi:chaperonin GroES